MALRSVVPPILALLLCVSLTQAKQCFDETVPLNNMRSIRLALRDWEASEINVQILSILLREKLGYKVETVAIGSEKEVWAGLEAGTIDVDTELWKNDLADYRDYIQVRASVADGGASGVVGRNGWYVPSYMVASTGASLSCPVSPPLAANCVTDLSLDYWRLYTSPTAVLFRRKSTDGVAEGHLYGAKTNWGASTAVIALHSNLAINAVLESIPTGVPWADHQSQLSTFMANREPLFFYHYEPHSFHSYHETTRIMLPATADVCWEAKTCDFDQIFVGKVYNIRMNEAEPDVAFLVRMFTLSNGIQSGIMKEMADGKSSFDAACDWLKTTTTTTSGHVSLWSAWLQTIPLEGCPPGFYVSGQTCLKCQSNTFKDETSHSDSCTACPLDTEFRGDAATNRSFCTCPFNFYHKNGSTYEGGESCLPCPAGTFCPGANHAPQCGQSQTADTRFAVVHITPREAQTFRCPMCSGNSNCSCDTTRAPGNAGFRCLGCKHTRFGNVTKSYFKSVGAQVCKVCPETVDGRATWPAETYVLMATLYLVAYLAVLYFAHVAQVSDKGYVVIKFLQTVTMVLSFDVAWPKVLKDVAEWLSFANFDFFVLVPFPCYPEFNTKDYFTYIICMPLPLCFLFIFANVFAYSTNKYLSPPPPGLIKKTKGPIMMFWHSIRYRKSEMELRLVSDLHIQAAIHFAQFVHVCYVQRFMSFYDCTEIAQGVSVMSNDPMVRCHGQEWNEAEPWAMAGLIIFVAGIPLVSFVIMMYGWCHGFRFDSDGDSFFVRKLRAAFHRKAKEATEKKGKARRSLQNANEELTALFDEYDMDNNGMLDSAEFETILERLDLHFPQWQVDDLLGELDPEGNGLDRAHLFKILKISLDDYVRCFLPLWGRYRGPYFWWELVLYAQNIATYALKVAFQDQLFALVVSMYLFGVYLALQIFGRPFRSIAGNGMQTTSLACVTVLNVGGVVLTATTNASDSRLSFVVMLATVMILPIGIVVLFLLASTSLIAAAKRMTMQRMDEWLALVPVFSNCEEGFLDIVKAHASQRKMLPGEEICSKKDVLPGEQQNQLWIVIEGEVIVQYEGGKNEVLKPTADTLPFFGELCSLNQRDHTDIVEARANVESTVVVLKESDIQTAFYKYPMSEFVLVSDAADLHPERGWKKAIQNIDSESLINIMADSNVHQTRKREASLELRGRMQAGGISIKREASRRIQARKTRGGNAPLFDRQLTDIELIDSESVAED